MLFYLIPYIYITFVSLNIYFSKIKVNARTIFLLLFPALLIVVLRGNVGTDSFFYLGLFEDYQRFGESNAKYEPGFETLGKTLIFLGASPRLGVALVGLISTLILCKAYSRSKNEMLILAMLVFPTFYYDFGMNGIRYGLSFCLATLGIDALYKKNYKLFALFSLLAVSMQYSSMLIILPFAGSLIKKKYVFIILFLLVAIIAVSPDTFAFFMDRVADKKGAYSQIYAPGITSGLAPLGLVLLMYFNFLWFHRKTDYSKLIHIILLLEILSFVFAKFSYAGLRFQGAYMYCMILYLKNNTRDDLRWRYSVNLVIISVLSIIIYYKNLTTVVQEEVTPFLPYKFFWEERYSDKL